ncbi:hypothetical protein CEXT_441461 [Caerostris extrusa]|uniref:Uncharacterized protein n=1 Tax=Caerostris extrusa TaxID=172846 RepID=A0AAV4PFN2_CAEEX|nr:hypothetical protein CEXT_441461 [Caerostris extrusa]
MAMDRQAGKDIENHRNAALRLILINVEYTTRIPGKKKIAIAEYYAEDCTILCRRLHNIMQKMQKIAEYYAEDSTILCRR